MDKICNGIIEHLITVEWRDQLISISECVCCHNQWQCLLCKILSKLSNHRLDTGGGVKLGDSAPPPVATSNLKILTLPPLCPEKLMRLYCHK